MDADIRAGSVRLLPLDPLDVDNKFLTVDLHHLANLLAFVVTSDNLQMYFSFVSTS